MNSPRPSIFHYHDHLVFLVDWLAHLKASQSAFSLRSLAKQAGLASGYLPMVLAGKRSLSHAALLKLMPHLQLDASEKSFLENLVVLGTADSHETRISALERMQRFSQFQKHQSQDSQVFNYLTHWYFVAIREMAYLPGFQGDAAWIQSRLRFAVPLKDVKDALAFLLENKYLETATDGQIHPPDKSLDCDSEGVYRLALGKFHREIFRLAAQSIQKTPAEERNIMGHTCVLSADNFAKAKAIMEEAVFKIRALEQAPAEAQDVYHLETALFPLTQPPTAIKRGTP